MFLIIFNSENGKNRLLPVVLLSVAEKRVTTGGNETTGGEITGGEDSILCLLEAQNLC